MYAHLTDIPTVSIKIDILNKSTINNEYILVIANRIKKNGMQKPIIVDEKLNCLLGTTRVRAAILLKIKTIKAIIFSTHEIKGYYRIKNYDELLRKII